MKRSKYLIFIFACILLIGCIPQPSTNNNGNESKDINPTQKAFYELATKYYEREDSLTNIVAKDELFNEYQSANSGLYGARLSGDMEPPIAWQN